MRAILSVLLCCVVLSGCCLDDEHKNINRCLADQDAEIFELTKRIRELEWKVKSLRYIEEQQFDEYKKLAEKKME